MRRSKFKILISQRNVPGFRHSQVTYGLANRVSATEGHIKVCEGVACTSRLKSSAQTHCSKGPTVIPPDLYMKGYISFSLEDPGIYLLSFSWSNSLPASNRYCHANTAETSKGPLHNMMPQ
jgi:hypothetical protein